MFITICWSTNHKSDHMLIHRNTRNAYLSCVFISVVEKIIFPLFIVCPYFLKKIMAVINSPTIVPVIHAILKLFIVSVWVNQKNKVNQSMVYNLTTSNILYAIVSWNAVYTDRNTLRKLTPIKYRHNVFMICTASIDLKWCIANRSAHMYMPIVIIIPRVNCAMNVSMIVVLYSSYFFSIQYFGRKYFNHSSEPNMFI